MIARSSLALVVLSGCLTIPDRPSAGSDAGVDGTAGHNEDGDAFLDAADPCPHLAAVQADNDTDGIGNDCDVDPESGGETVLFFTFEKPGDLAMFTKSGTVDQGDDVVVVGGLTGDSSALLSFPYTEFVMDAEVDFITLGGQDFRGMGLLTNFTDTDDFDKCYFGQYDDLTDVRGGIDQSNTSNVDVPFPGVDLLDVVRLHVHVTRLGDVYKCTLAGPVSAVFDPSSALTETGPMFGLFANNAIVQFRYLYLAGRP